MSTIFTPVPNYCNVFSLVFATLFNLPVYPVAFPGFLLMSLSSMLLHCPSDYCCLSVLVDFLDFYWWISFHTTFIRSLKTPVFFLLSSSYPKAKLVGSWQWKRLIAQAILSGTFTHLFTLILRQSQSTFIKLGPLFIFIWHRNWYLFFFFLFILFFLWIANCCREVMFCVWVCMWEQQR